MVTQFGLAGFCRAAPGLKQRASRLVRELPPSQQTKGQRLNKVADFARRTFSRRVAAVEFSRAVHRTGGEWPAIHVASAMVESRSCCRSTVADATWPNLPHFRAFQTHG